MDLEKLKRRFHDELIETNEISVRKCKHNPVRIRSMMAEFGAVETAKKLMLRDPSTSGYIAMAECGCLDITIEATMLRSEFAGLFTEKELCEARRRLPSEVVSKIVFKK